MMKPEGCTPCMQVADAEADEDVEQLAPWPDHDPSVQRQTVWILAGGDSVDRQASFAAGQHVLQQLLQQPDIQVCAKGPSCYVSMGYDRRCSYCTAALQNTIDVARSFANVRTLQLILQQPWAQYGMQGLSASTQGQCTPTLPRFIALRS